MLKRLLGLAAAVVTVACGIPAVQAAEVRVMTSGAFADSLKELVPEFERRTGHRVIAAFGASMGGAADSIPARMDRGEPVDVVILARPALDALVAGGRVAAGSPVDIVRSVIGMVVRAGEPKPDISSPEALSRALLEAKSIAYSASASGTYLSTELFPRLGVWEAIRDKSTRIVSERVARVVARGEAQIGFQQVSELVTIPGVDFVGPLPPGAQRATYFSAGIAANAKAPGVAKEFVEFLSSPAADPVIRRNGLEPAREGTLSPS